jgi:hypothetical protein
MLLKVQSVRPLEFYMPVPSHRSRWTGGGDLLIVSQLEDSSRMVAFNLNGDEVAVSRDAPPSTPTLAIVPGETRFDRPMSLAEAKNMDDAGGNAIGTLTQRPLKVSRLDECGDNCGGGGSSYYPAGFYMTFSRIVDMGEPWTKGDPEIEVHVHGPVSGGNAQYGEDLACSGEHALPERSFDQDNAFWNGSVLIWTKTQAESFNAEFPEGHQILFWEDDDTPCTLKFDKSALRDALLSIGSWVGGAALKAGGFGTIGVGLILSSFLANAYTSADWLTSNDDFLGALTPAAAHGDNWSDANHTLLKTPTEVNGRAMIVFK